MVVKKSEYQMQFKSSVIKRHHAEYLANLNLRHQRRDREFVHTPICWGEPSEEDDVEQTDGSDECCIQNGKEKRSEEPESQYQSLAEILSEAKEKGEALRKKQREEKFEKYSEAFDAGKKSHDDEEDVNLKSDIKENADKSRSIYDMVDDENRKLNKKLAQTYVLRKGKLVEDITDESDTDQDMKAADRLLVEAAKTSESNLRKKAYRKKRSKESHALHKDRSLSEQPEGPSKTNSKGRTYAKPSCPVRSSTEVHVPPLSLGPRLRRPDRQNRIPKAKRRPVSAGTPLKDRPPFLAYGVGDREDNLAIHRTHNVRALADVYMPALRAKIRREEQRRRQQETLERTLSAEALLDKLSSLTPRDPSDWESEYRKQFHGYEPRDYERAVSSRSVIPRASPVRAVHRGGCLVVHVD